MLNDDKYDNLSDEEVGKAVRKEHQQRKENQRLTSLRYEIYDPMKISYNLLYEKYRGDKSRVRFADISPFQMLQDIYVIEESLKAAREKICNYIDEIKKYEDEFETEYRY